VISRHEVLANAFVHRDYAIGGGSVGVALYDDRLEIISIGDLHFDLTPEALFREPPGQAGKGDADGVGAGGVAVR